MLDGTDPRGKGSAFGSSALMLQTGYERGTKDNDVLETQDLTADVKQRLLELAGAGTELHATHRIYLDVVPNGIPFLPQRAVYRGQTDLNATIRRLELEVLDVVDVVVAKLKRFHANDRSDIAAMVDLDLVPHERLVSRFREAADYFAGDARAEELPRYLSNLHIVERDFLAVEPTEIELPEWHWRVARGSRVMPDDRKADPSEMQKRRIPSRLLWLGYEAARAVTLGGGGDVGYRTHARSTG
jgi:uncharacterized nucleotidyltransferase DUF6036